MKSSVTAYGLFFAFAAGLALFAWTDEEEASGEGFVLLDAEPDALTRITYTWPKGELELSFEGAGEARRPVAKLEHERPAEKPEVERDAGPDAGLADEPATEVASPRETSRFPAGSVVSRSVDKLAPLRARRSLGVPDTERLEAMGLASPERRLVVEAGGEKVVLDVGVETYGNQGRYARLGGQSEVFLLDSGATSGLEGSEVRLMEARLVVMNVGDIVSMNAASDGRSARFVHVERAQPTKRYFAPEGREDDKSEEASGLVTTLRSLRAKRYLDESTSAGARELAEVTFELDKSPPFVLSIFELPNQGGYRARAGGFVGELTEARGKKAIEDILAVLPAP